MITNLRLTQLKNTVVNIASELTRRAAGEANPTVRSLLKQGREEAEQLLDTIGRIEMELEVQHEGSTDIADE